MSHLGNISFTTPGDWDLQVAFEYKEPDSDVGFPGELNVLKCVDPIGREIPTDKLDKFNISLEEIENDCEDYAKMVAF